jgi:hypothetical protein
MSVVSVSWNGSKRLIIHFESINALTVLDFSSYFCLIFSTDISLNPLSLLDFLKDIIKLLKDRKYTFGFELLNEPEVFEVSHYQKVGQYHDYMIKCLRKITDKLLFFCWALPHDVSDNPLLQAQTTPTIRDNVIYDGHSYPPSLERTLYFALIRLLMKNVSLYIGEFNSGYTKGTTLTQKQIYQYLKMFKKVGTCGWALWRWSYMEDLNIPAFNLTKVVKDSILPGRYFMYLINVLKNCH